MAANTSLCLGSPQRLGFDANGFRFAFFDLFVVEVVSCLHSGLPVDGGLATITDRSSFPGPCSVLARFTQARGKAPCSKPSTWFVKLWLEVQGALLLLPFGVISYRYSPVATETVSLNWGNDHLWDVGWPAL